jgi:hypothetical protein
MKSKKTLLAAALSAGLFSVTSAHAAVLLFEDFEDGSLDPRISVSTVGTFLSAPGIKTFANIEGNKAFGFGRSTNTFNSFYNFVTTLTITLPSPTFVSSISFREMEVFDNWGSSGAVYADGLLISPFFGFGHLPYNDRIADTAPRFHEFAINASVSRLALQVHDITNLSEIYIDQITVSAAPVPEPETYAMLLAGLGLLSFTARRRKQST